MLLCSVTPAPAATLMEKVMSHFFNFLFVLSFLSGTEASLSLSLSLGSHNLIIILSAARARLIDVPLDCLLQADDLTKAFCST